MKFCWNDWQPLLSTPQGQAWFRPIGLLGEDDFSLDQDELTKTPAMRAALALQVPLFWSGVELGINRQAAFEFLYRH